MQERPIHFLKPPGGSAAPGDAPGISARQIAARMFENTVMLTEDVRAAMPPEDLAALLDYLYPKPGADPDAPPAAQPEAAAAPAPAPPPTRPPAAEHQPEPAREPAAPRARAAPPPAAPPRIAPTYVAPPPAEASSRPIVREGRDRHGRPAAAPPAGGAPPVERRAGPADRRAAPPQDRAAPPRDRAAEPRPLPAEPVVPIPPPPPPAAAAPSATAPSPSPPPSAPPASPSGEAADRLRPPEVAPPPPPAGETDAPRIYSPSGKRVHPRVSMPATARFAGHSYPVENWSLGGFGLTGAGPALAAGEIASAALVFQLGYAAITVEATVTVVRVAAGTARGFQFVALPVDRARVLRQISDLWLSGELIDIDRLDNPASGAAPDAEARRSRHRRGRRSAAVARTAAVLVIGVAATMLAIGYIAVLLSTVRSDYAAVAATYTPVRAPASGLFGGPTPEIGASVAAGQAIGEIVPGRLDDDRAALEARIAALEVRLTQRRAALEASRAAVSAAGLRAAGDLAGMQRRREMLERELEAQTRTQAQLTVRPGIDPADPKAANSLSRIVALDRLVTLERELAEARAVEERSRQRLGGMSDGVIGADGRSAEEPPAAIEADIAEIEADLTEARRRLAALQPVSVASPCDCVVAAATVSPGAFVAAGDVLYDLDPSAGEEFEVDALVPLEPARLLRVGQAAEVVLASSPDPLAGTVRAISFGLPEAGRKGLPAQQVGGPFATVTIGLPPGAASAPPVGMPAVVTARTRLRDWLQRVTGLSLPALP